jgi:tetratricopeptide (TPR) repeat protein
MLPAIIPKAQIWTFNFELEWPNNSPSRTLSYIGSKLLEYIDDNLKDQKRAVVFVGHGIGGLVVMSAMTYLGRYGDLHQVVGRTSGVVFLGTPFHGDVSWANLTRDFSNMAQDQGLPTECFHEQTPTHRQILKLRERFTKSHRQNGTVKPNEIVQCLDGHHRVPLRTTLADMNRFSSPRDENFQIVSRNILQMAPKTRPISPLPANSVFPLQHRPIFSVPYTQNPEFVGRESIMDEIQRKMSFRPGFQARIGLWGLGGIGKTQIATRYAYSMREKFDDVSVFWIRAASRDRFEDSYLELAHQFGIEFPQDGAVDKLQLVADHLRGWKNGRWLMIVDNADEVSHFISTFNSKDEGTTDSPGLAKYIPVCDKGSVLITSRVKHVCVELAGSSSIIHINKMEMRDCKLLLQACWQDEQSEVAATSLSSALEYLPLALRQAVAFMTMNSMAISKYLELFNQSEISRVALLSDDSGAEIKDGARNAIGKTWIISFNQIKRIDPAAVDLLSFMSFIDRQDISKSILPGGKSPSTIQFEKALGTLQGYSMISAGSKEDSYDIHGLIQLSMRSWLEGNGEREKYLKKVVNEFSYNFPDPIWFYWQECACYLPHIQALFHHCPSIDDYDAEKRKQIVLTEPYSFDPVEGCDTRNQIALFLEAARYLSTQGRYWEAEVFEQRSWTMANEIFGPDDLLTIRSLNNLSQTYSEQGRWQEAEPMDVEVFEKHKSILGSDSPEALNCMGNLASTLLQLGKVEEAKALHIQALDATRRVQGEDHNDTFYAMANLAMAYKCLGEWDESENLYKEALEGWARVQGYQNDWTLTCASVLVSLHVVRGNLLVAEEMARNVLDTSKIVLGEYHEGTLYSLSDLMKIYEKLGKLEEAELLSKEALEKSKKIFGETHSFTFKTQRAFERLERPRSWWRDTPPNWSELSIREKNIDANSDDHPKK